MGQALREVDPGVELMFVGSSHGPEGKLAVEAGIPFQSVPSAPLTKSLSFRNAASLLKLVTSFFIARRILKSFAPDVVIGTGGYTTAAVLLAARSLHSKIMIHEQNAVPGRTNLWLARIADKVCVSFDSSAAFFPKEKVEVTGMPIRSGFSNMPDKLEARKQLGLDADAFTVLVVGGSQGAKKLNELVIGMLGTVDDGKSQILHQVGTRNVVDISARDIASSHMHHYAAYLDMPIALAAADLVISRSGASTIAEITAARLPSILVPYPYAYANHQKRNAEYVVGHHAAILCEESLITEESLGDLVGVLRASPDKLNAMASSSASIAKVDAARSVAELATGMVNE